MHKYLLKSSLFIGCFLMSVSASWAQCGDRYFETVFDETDIVETQDIQYGSNIQINGDNKVLKFDFYAPGANVDPLEARPLIIWAHGGFFVGGDENNPNIQTLANDFAQKGYACASINYRLIDSTTDITPNFLSGTLDALFIDEITRAVGDMRAAIRFFRQDAATDNLYGIDPNQIYIGGVSAGGVLSAHVAYLENEEGLDAYPGPDILSYIEANGGFEGDSGNPGYLADVQGVISLSGAIGDTAFIQAGETRIINVHEENDGVVPYGNGLVNFGGFDISEMQGSSLVQERMTNLGNESYLLSFPTAGHTNYFDNPSQLSETLSFITTHLADWTDCTGAPFIANVETISCSGALPNDTITTSNGVQDSLVVVSYIAGSTDIVYIEDMAATPTGNDTLILSNALGCDSTVITTFTTTSVESVFLDNLHIYPNPVRDQLSIQLGGNAGERVNMRLLNQSGQEVFTHQSPANLFLNIDVSTLTAGIYTLMLEQDDKQMVRKVVVY